MRYAIDYNEDGSVDLVPITDTPTGSATAQEWTEVFSYASGSADNSVVNATLDTGTYKRFRYEITFTAPYGSDTGTVSIPILSFNNTAPSDTRYFSTSLSNAGDLLQANVAEIRLARANGAGTVYAHGFINIAGLTNAVMGDASLGMNGTTARYSRVTGYWLPTVATPITSMQLKTVSAAAVGANSTVKIYAK